MQIRIANKIIKRIEDTQTENRQTINKYSHITGSLHSAPVNSHYSQNDESFHSPKLPFITCFEQTLVPVNNFRRCLPMTSCHLNRKNKYFFIFLSINNNNWPFFIVIYVRFAIHAKFRMLMHIRLLYVSFTFAIVTVFTNNDDDNDSNER